VLGAVCRSGKAGLLAESLLSSFHVLSQLGLSVLLEKPFLIQGAAAKGDIAG